MNSPTLERDERTVAVENASYRWGYLVLSYALLADMIWRGGVRHEAAWDLMAFVVIGGVVCFFYQARQRILGHNWLIKVVLVACIAAVVAAVIAMSHGWWNH